MKNVHVIFKTHLDFGFTDLSANVFRRYQERFIPQALARARQLREAGGPERFIWTTGSWLVHEYLEKAGARARKEMEAAIAAGDIVWHALPYTTHTELMDESLFRYGLSLAQDLESRFGYKTIAAKMTDVPGHCRAMVPLLAEAGVQFLHIGVNPACTPPQVPPLFRWQAPGGSEIIVAYSSDYGNPSNLKGLEDALVFAHTGDNSGPPPAENILHDFQKFRESYPGAKVMASTLDAFAKAVIPHREKLPLVTDEIGDTWIHGGGTDPRKVAEYRALCRLRNQWEKTGQAKKFRKAFRASSQFLLNVAEHTWGMDEKTHLGDFVNYGPKELARARKRDLVSPSARPPEYDYFGPFTLNSVTIDNTPQERRFSTFSSSWDEQRGYIRGAVRALKGTPLAAEARRELRRLRPVEPSLRGFTSADIGEELTLGRFSVRFNPVTGAMIHLQAKEGKSPVCTPENPLGLFRYQTFSQGDYDRFRDAYVIHREVYRAWIDADIAKPGMDRARPEPRQAFHASERTHLQVRLGRGDKPDEAILSLHLPKEVCREGGAPKKVFLRYIFPRTEPGFQLEVTWFEKTATRLPEAAWLSFQPKVRSAKAWRMEKMGQSFSPLEICAKGGRNLHGIGREIRNDAFFVESLDAPLVAPGRPRLLEFDNTQPPLAGGMHFNLHNNVWGTNFPMWYEDDALFRFAIGGVV